MKALVVVKGSTAAGTEPNRQQMRTLHQQISQETITKLRPVLAATQLQKFEILQHAMMHGHCHHGGGGTAGTPTPATTTH